MLPIIAKVCKPGTIIQSDEWAAYNQIQSKLGFEHKTVNHSLHFVDPSTNVHTQHIESYWSKQKLKIKAMKGVKATNLPSILKEFMWKDNYRDSQLIYIISLLQTH